MSNPSTKAGTALLVIGIMALLIASGFTVYLAGTGKLFPTIPPASPQSSQSHSTTTSSTITNTSSTTSSGVYPPLIAVSGRVTTTGNGTHPTNLTFNGPTGSFTTPAKNGNYSVSLPNLVTYSISLSWNGSYPWQGGSILAGNVTLQETGANLVENIQAQTPDSQITISGSATSSGSGTKPSFISFLGEGQNFSATVSSSGQYSIAVANYANYSSSIHWLGEYPWQMGSIIISNPVSVQMPAGYSVLSEPLFQISTPDSLINVSGTMSTSLPGTHPTNVSFASLFGGLSLTAPATNCSHRTCSYSIMLPNLMQYNVTVYWASFFVSGQCTPSNSPISVNEPPGISNATINLKPC